MPKIIEHNIKRKIKNIKKVFSTTSKLSFCVLTTTSIYAVFKKLNIDITYIFTNIFTCTNGEIRTPNQWFWRPLRYQLRHIRKICGGNNNENIDSYILFFYRR